MMIILAIAVFFLLGTAFAAFGKTIPEKVAEIYPLQSNDYLITGRLRTYISPEPPLPTAEKLRKKLGRPTEMTNLSQWKTEATRPIILLYRNYAISVEGIEGNRSRVEVTTHDTAYNRHQSHFIHYWGGPTVRRGNVFNWGGNSGPGRVQDGGIGGIGGK